MTQRLKRSALPPPDRGGLDWNAIAQQRRERLEAEAAKGVPEAIRELAGQQNPEKPAKVRKIRTSNGPPKGSPRVGGRRPTYEAETVVEMYKTQKMRIGEIATALGAHRSTIHRILGPDGANLLPPSGEKGGPRRVEKCKRGHPMVKPEQYYLVAKGGRGCRECKRNRDHDSYLRARARTDTQTQEKESA